METLIAIAMLALSLFGPGWSSDHKAFWEWQLGHQLEGYQEHRLARNWRPDGGGPLIPDGQLEGIAESPEHATGFIPPQPELCTIFGVFDGETVEYFAFCHSP